MAVINSGGYIGKLLRVDLTDELISQEDLDEATLRKYLGGTALGAKYLFDEVPPVVEWSNPENRLIFFTGPLNGQRISGSGTYSVLTKGPMTNMAAASQANGYLGAYLKFSGFDGLIVQGKANRWVYLHIHDGMAELRDAIHLLGKDTWETEDAIRQQLATPCAAVSIGPSGENLVRFAAIVGSHGHVAAHNGLGAVMGSKKLKAIVAERSKQSIPACDSNRLKQAATAMFENARDYGLAGPIPNMFNKWGTGAFYSTYAQTGRLPIKNLTTNLFPDHERFNGQYLRTHFKLKRWPCWACRASHGYEITVTEGPYKGYTGKEPEYEQMVVASSLTDQHDPGTAIVLANIIDRLGMDNNEAGWVLGWIMECYEKGLLSKDDLDGLDMTWGNGEAIAQMLQKIAHRQGCGDRFAEGVKRAAEQVGIQALDCAVFTLKGAAPRDHDHRANWSELIDTCLSNTGTIEATGYPLQTDQLGLTPVHNQFDPEEVSTMNAMLNGRRQFEDSLVLCRFCTHDLQLTIDTVNAATGWDLDKAEAMNIGLRAVNILRVFNFRHGLTKEMEAPSVRYGSAPVDGPAHGISILPHWHFIRRNYYEKMGWDPNTGKPLPETLDRLGLAHLVSQI
ncbi:aldehyde ferredoxin oxidoreductase family protein [Chloroflexota bacterium]